MSQTEGKPCKIAAKLLSRLRQQAVYLCNGGGGGCLESLSVHMSLSIYLWVCLRECVHECASDKTVRQRNGQFQPTWATQ